MLQQRAAEFGQRVELSVHAPAKPGFKNRAASADGRCGVTRNTRDVVENRPEAPFRSFLVQKLVRPGGERCELVRREAGKRLAKLWRPGGREELRKGDNGERRAQHGQECEFGDVFHVSGWVHWFVLL